MRVRVVLLEPEHEGNVGAVARIMKNFGFSDLWIVNPKTEIDRQARAYASHANDVLQRSKIADTLEEAIKNCDHIAGTTAIPGRRPSNVLRLALSPEEYADRIKSSKERVCLIFGRESTGLSVEELNRCDMLITIPANKEYRTLNLATACGIILYELYKRVQHIERTAQPADSQTRGRLLRYFEELAFLVRSPNHRRKIAVRAFRNVLSRGLVSKREALVLMGIIRRACNRTRNDGDSA